MLKKKIKIKITGTDRKKVKKKQTDTKTPKIAFFFIEMPYHKKFQTLHLEHYNYISVVVTNVRIMHTNQVATGNI